MDTNILYCDNDIFHGHEMITQIYIRRIDTSKNILNVYKLIK